VKPGAVTDIHHANDPRVVYAMEQIDLLLACDPQVARPFHRVAQLAWLECTSEYGVQAVLAVLVAAHAARANRSGSLPYGVRLPDLSGIVPVRK